MKKLDFAITIDGRLAFSTNDACNALQFYDSAKRGLRNGKQRKIFVFYKGRKLDERQVSSVSWC